MSYKVFKYRKKTEINIPVVIENYNLSYLNNVYCLVIILCLLGVYSNSNNSVYRFYCFTKTYEKCTFYIMQTNYCLHYTVLTFREQFLQEISLNF